MDRPTVFVGSSREGLEIARAIQFQLKDDALVSVWNEGLFGLGQGTLESLVVALDRFDFAVLVITPDDVVATRETASQAPRDNVMFELGLFLGRLGRARTFAVCSNARDLKLPSDLAGVTLARFDQTDAGIDVTSALGPACTQIRSVIGRLGVLAPGDPRRGLRKALDDQQAQIDEQSETIRQIVAFSMSFHIYEHLRALYYKRVGEAYLYQPWHERDLRFLRDHGYIESRSPKFLQVSEIANGTNLLDVIKLTPAGEFYVRLREGLEAAENQKGRTSA